MRKKILAFALAACMAMSLCACSKDSAKKDEMQKVNPKEVTEAFCEYYDEFCEKHKGGATGGADNQLEQYWDCIARMVYFDNQPMMVIADLIGSSGSDLSYDIHVLAYEGDNVVEKYTIQNLLTWDDCLSIHVGSKAIIIDSVANEYNQDHVYYELIDGKVNAYRYSKVDNSDDLPEEYAFYDLKGNNGQPIEVDRYVQGASILPNNNPKDFILGELADNATYGALVDENFKSYLNKVAELDNIENEGQLEEIYCSQMGYSYSATINDAILADSNLVEFTINGEKYTFSYEEGISGLKNMPVSVLSCEIEDADNPRAVRYIQSVKYIRVKNPSDFISSCESVNSDEAGAIIASITGTTKSNIINGEKQTEEITFDDVINDNRYRGNFAVYGFLYENDQYNLGGKDNHAISVGDTYYASSYNNYDVLRLDFIENYEIDGINNTSTMEDILNAGFNKCGMNTMYYKVYSDNPASTENINKDYATLYNANLQQEYVINGQMEQYIDYSKVFYNVQSKIYSGLNYINNLTPCSESQREKYEDGKDSIIRNEEKMYNDYEDAVKTNLDISTQLFLLETGEIDYFVVAVVQNPQNQFQRITAQISFDENTRYERNVLSLYIVGREGEYDKWVTNAGWIDSID